MWACVRASVRACVRVCVRVLNLVYTNQDANDSNPRSCKICTHAIHMIPYPIHVVGEGVDVVPINRSNPPRPSFLFKSCGLWTLSCDFVPHN